MKLTNRARAIRIELIIKAVSPYNQDPYNAIRDMLADMMHYCRKHEIDFDDELYSAGNNYEAEVEEEGTVSPKTTKIVDRLITGLENLLKENKKESL